MEEKRKLINVSEINAWLYCPRKVFITKVLKIFQPPNRAMIIGKIKHNILETFSKREEAFISSIEKDYEKIDLLFMYEDFLRNIANIVFIENMEMIDRFMIDKEDIMKKVLRDFSEDIKQWQRLFQTGC